MGFRQPRPDAHSERRSGRCWRRPCRSPGPCSPCSAGRVHRRRPARPVVEHRPVRGYVAAAAPQPWRRLSSLLRSRNEDEAGRREPSPSGCRTEGSTPGTRAFCPSRPYGALDLRAVPSSPRTGQADLLLFWVTTLTALSRSLFDPVLGLGAGPGSLAWLPRWLSRIYFHSVSCTVKVLLWPAASRRQAVVAVGEGRSGHGPVETGCGRPGRGCWLPPERLPATLFLRRSLRKPGEVREPGTCAGPRPRCCLDVVLGAQWRSWTQVRGGTSSRRPPVAGSGAPEAPGRSGSRKPDKRHPAGPDPRVQLASSAAAERGRRGRARWSSPAAR